MRAERVRRGLAALHSQGERLTIRSVGDRVYGARCLNTIIQGNQFVSCPRVFLYAERFKCLRDRDNFSSLHVACYHGHVKLVTLFITQERNVNDCVPCLPIDLAIRGNSNAICFPRQFRSGPCTLLGSFSELIYRPLYPMLRKASLWLAVGLRAPITRPSWFASVAAREWIMSTTVACPPR